MAMGLQLRSNELSGNISPQICQLERKKKLSKEKNNNNKKKTNEIQSTYNLKSSQPVNLGTFRDSSPHTKTLH